MKLLQVDIKGETVADRRKPQRGVCGCAVVSPSLPELRAVRDEEFPVWVQVALAGRPLRREPERPAPISTGQLGLFG